MTNRVTAVIDGHTLTLETLPHLFSPASIDAGTLAMLSLTEITSEDKVLDLGCGYGVCGIVPLNRAQKM